MQRISGALVPKVPEHKFSAFWNLGAKCIGPYMLVPLSTASSPVQPQPAIDIDRLPAVGLGTALSRTCMLTSWRIWWGFFFFFRVNLPVSTYSFASYSNKFYWLHLFLPYCCLPKRTPTAIKYLQIFYIFQTPSKMRKKSLSGVGI